MRVAFLHPDLGLGGAERLIVDAATELVSAGHTVDVYTAYYNPERCFEETKTAGFRVIVAGGWFPRHIARRMVALCAYIRCILVAIYLAWTSRNSQARYEVVIVDQVSVVIPILLWVTRSKVIFYCHFPDLLLSQRRGWLKKAYRAPLDWMEQTTTGMAHLTLVNSKFTQGVFEQTFSRLHSRGMQPKVLYPAVRVPSEQELASAGATWQQLLGPELSKWIQEGPLVVSINRFERKKGLDLAIKALKEVLQPTSGNDHHQQGVDSRTSDSPARLLMAGGWDARLEENVQHLQELKDLVASLGLEDRVRFLPSFTDTQRTALLAACQAVVYTPQFEHFGIVPLEAMAAGRPVIAVNNGGPTESVVQDQTGLLCEPTPAAFAAAYEKLLNNSSLAETMGKAARQHVIKTFSRQTFGSVLNEYVCSLVKDGAVKRASAQKR